MAGEGTKRKAVPTDSPRAKGATELHPAKRRKGVGAERATEETRLLRLARPARPESRGAISGEEVDWSDTPLTEGEPKPKDDHAEPSTPRRPGMRERDPSSGKVSKGDASGKASKSKELPDPGSRDFSDFSESEGETIDEKAPKNLRRRISTNM